LSFTCTMSGNIDAFIYQREKNSSKIESCSLMRGKTNEEM